MQFSTPPSSISTRTSVSRDERIKRVLVVGPELIANALFALLSTFEDLQVLTPLSDPSQTLIFLERVNSTGQTIDVVLLHWSGDLEEDHSLLQTLSEAQHRCLVVTPLYLPSEIDFIRSAGAWGLFFTTSPVRELATALHTIADGQSSFPTILPPAPQRDLSPLTKPRQVAFHEERLWALGRSIMRGLSETDIQIFRHFTDGSIEEIAARVHLRPTTVRTELSGRIYQFLKLISGQTVTNRLVAFQVLLQYGVIEYLPPPPEKRSDVSSP